MYTCIHEFIYIYMKPQGKCVKATLLILALNFVTCERGFEALIRNLVEF